MYRNDKNPNEQINPLHSYLGKLISNKVLLCFKCLVSSSKTKETSEPPKPTSFALSLLVSFSHLNFIHFSLFSLPSHLVHHFKNNRPIKRSSPLSPNGPKILLLRVFHGFPCRKSVCTTRSKNDSLKVVFSNRNPLYVGEYTLPRVTHLEPGEHHFHSLLTTPVGLKNKSSLTRLKRGVNISQMKILPQLNPKF